MEREEGIMYVNFTKTEYLNASIKEFLNNDLEDTIYYCISTLEQAFICFSNYKLKDILKKTKKIYNEYKIVSEDENRIGDIDFRFTICFLKYHKFTFKHIKKFIQKGYKQHSSSIMAFRDMLLNKH